MSSQGNLDLIKAAQKGQVATVYRLLTRSDVDKNFQDEGGKTALHDAAEKGHLKVVNALLQAGADVNLQDKLGQTALLDSAEKGHLKIVNALLQAGAFIHLQNKNGNTVLDVTKNNKIKALLTQHFGVGKREQPPLPISQTSPPPAPPSPPLSPSSTLAPILTQKAMDNNAASTTPPPSSTLPAAAGSTEAYSLPKRTRAVSTHPSVAAFQTPFPTPTPAFVVAQQPVPSASGPVIALGPAVTPPSKPATPLAPNLPPASTPAGPAGPPVPPPLQKKKKKKKSKEYTVTAPTIEAVPAPTPVAFPEPPSVDRSSGRPSSPIPAPPLQTAVQPVTVGQPVTACSQAVSIPPFPTQSPPCALTDTLQPENSPAQSQNQKVHVVLAQATGVQARREWMQRRHALQAQYDAARAAKKFPNALKLKKELSLLDIESASLSLSLEDFQTLFDRYTQLLSSLEDQCEQLFLAEDSEALEALAALLDSLQSLDPIDLTFPSANPFILSEDDSGSSNLALQEALLSEVKFFCGTVPILVSTCLDAPAVRKLYRGRFSDTVVSTACNTKTVNDVACLVKCAVCADRTATHIESSVQALRHEHIMYALIQALVKDSRVTGCVHCYSAHPSYHYLVLEDYGQDLTHLFTDQVDNGLQVICAISEAVGALHGLNIMHGDIKPQNLLYEFNKYGKCVVKLCDLDCAQKVGEDCVATSLGSMYFHPPEVFRAAYKKESIKSTLEIDLFALGLVFWQLLERSSTPALTRITSAQLENCYSNKLEFWEHLAEPARGKWFYSHIKALTSQEPRHRTPASTLLRNIHGLDASSAMIGWLEEQQRNEQLQHNVVDRVTQLQQSQDNLSDKVDAANAKLDRVLEVLQSMFDALGQKVVGVAATLRKEMLLGREQGQVLEGMVQATQDTLQQLLAKAPGDNSANNGSQNGDQIARLLITLQSRIEESVTTAVSMQQPSSPSQTALTEMSAQFKAQFSTLNADLQMFMEDQRRAQATSATTLQDQQRQAQQMQQCLASSLQDVLRGLSGIKQEVAQLRQGQEELGRQVAYVLSHHKDLADKVNWLMESQKGLAAMNATLITGMHSIPTLAIILPVVSTSWGSLLNPMRLMRNRFRLYFLCSHTHRKAPCGPDGKGYEITVTKQWVQDAAPVLKVGLMIIKLALLSAGLPLPVPDLPALLNTSGLHAKYLDAALHMVQNPDLVTGSAEYVMDKVIQQLDSCEEHSVFKGQGKSKKGVLALQEGSRKAYQTIQELLRELKINIALTSGLRQVTHGGKTAWVLDSDDVVEQFKATVL